MINLKLNSDNDLKKVLKRTCDIEWVIIFIAYKDHYNYFYKY